MRMVVENGFIENRKREEVILPARVYSNEEMSGTFFNEKELADIVRTRELAQKKKFEASLQKYNDVLYSVLVEAANENREQLLECIKTNGFYDLYEYTSFAKLDGYWKMEPSERMKISDKPTVIELAGLSEDGDYYYTTGTYDMSVVVRHTDVLGRLNCLFGENFNVVDNVVSVVNHPNYIVKKRTVRISCISDSPKSRNILVKNHQKWLAPIYLKYETYRGDSDKAFRIV